MSSDRDVTRIVRSWLEEGVTALPDPVLDAVLDQVPATPQRRATWWPARRFSDMTPTVRFAVAAAAVVLVAAVAYGVWVQPNVGQTTATPTPTAFPSISGPGNVPAPWEPVAFTACLPSNAVIVEGSSAQVPVADSAGMNVDRQRGSTFRGTIESTDPRLSGTHYYTWESDNYATSSGDTVVGLFMEGHRIENDEGAWQARVTGVRLPDDTFRGGLVLLTGEGAYDGLTAVMYEAEGPCFFDYEGWIVAVPEPPVPYSGE